MHASFCVIKGPNSISFAKVLLCLMNSHDFLGSGIINSSEILEGLFKKKNVWQKVSHILPMIAMKQELEPVNIYRVWDARRTKAFKVSPTWFTALTHTVPPALPSGGQEYCRVISIKCLVISCITLSWPSSINISNWVIVQTAGFHLSSSLAEHPSSGGAMGSLCRNPHVNAGAGFAEELQLGTVWTLDCQ